MKPRRIFSDYALASRDHLLVALIIKFKSKPPQSSAYLRTHFRRVLSDAAGKDNRIRSVHCGQVCANVFARAVTENLDSEFGTAVVRFARFIEQFAHVVRQA